MLETSRAKRKVWRVRHMKKSVPVIEAEIDSLHKSGTDAYAHAFKEPQSLKASNWKVEERAR